mmetsp:Transcript_7817/g.34813  ORF Transcript_7817/g.34813 Transcript_7817/m.34813 type:complete len:103 (-) Transcript_7817:978-1286(-)
MFKPMGICPFLEEHVLLLRAEIEALSGKLNSASRDYRIHRDCGGYGNVEALHETHHWDSKVSGISTEIGHSQANWDSVEPAVVLLSAWYQNSTHLQDSAHRR